MFVEQKGGDLAPFVMSVGEVSVDSHERAWHDAYYARMYSLMRYELHYIFDPKGVSGPHLPDGMFRVLEEKERR